MADFIDQNLGQRRAEIRRGLSRSNTAAIGILVLVIVLASLAVRHAFHADSVARKAQRHEQEAVRASKRAETELWNSLQTQARASRLTGIAGRRTNALQAIAAAAAIRPADSLRDEAIASLALTDLGPVVFEKNLGRFRIGPQHGVKLQRAVFLETERRLRIYRLPSWEAAGEIAVDRPPVMALRIDPRERFVALQLRDSRLQIWDLDGEGASKLHWETKAQLFSFERNGEELLTCRSDGAVHRLELAGKSEEEVLRLDRMPWDLVLNGAGTRLAATYGNRVEIWDVQSRQKLNELETPDRIRPLKWHPGSRHLAIGLMNAEVWLWDTTTNLTRVLSGHTAPIDALAFDPSGDLLLSASWDSSTRFWDARSGEFLFATREAYARHFSEDGRRVTWQREEDTVGIWEVLRSPILRRIQVPRSEPRPLGGVAYWQDNAHLALADSQSVQIWDLEKNALLFDAPMQIAATVLFRPETKSMFASSRTGLFRWGVSQEAGSGIAVGKREVLVRPQRGGLFERCALSPEGDFLAVVGGTEALVLNLADPGKPLRLKKTPSALVQVALGPQARLVAAGTWKGWGMGVWDGQSGELLRKLSDENCAVNFSRDGSMLAVSTPSGYSVYETTNWNLRFHVPSQVAGVVPGAINFNRDGTLLAVSPGIPPVHLVDPHSGRLLGKLTPPNIKNVCWIDFSPDGEQLAAATDHSNVDVWNLHALGKELAALNLGWDIGATNVARSIPALASAVPSSVATPSRGRVLVPTIGVGLALLLAVMTIGYHRRWLGMYDQVEDLAAQRQRDLVRTQGELMQSQKMQALGTLAAGIAHDFNNLLSVIRLSNDFLKRGVKGDPNLAEETEAITRAVHQGKSVVNSMLGYTRSQPDDRASINICEVVEDLVAMLSHQFLAGVQLTVDLDKEAPLVEAPRSALQQVLLNLVVNACEAMKFRGKLRISVTVAESAPTSGLVKSPRPGSHYVVLTVADNGPGMHADIQSRIFEPFFTTKQLGASPGRGLGLSTVYMIAEQEGLGLGLESAPQQGTVFRIFIPAPAPQ